MKCGAWRELAQVLVPAWTTPTGRPRRCSLRNGHESIHAVLQPPLPSDALPPPNLLGASFGGGSEMGRDSINRTGAEDYGGSWEEQQRRHPPRPGARRVTITSQAPPLQVQQQQQSLHAPQHWQCPERPLRMEGQDFPTPLTTTRHHQQQQKYPQRQRLGFQHWHNRTVAAATPAGRVPCASRVTRASVARRASTPEQPRRPSAGSGGPPGFAGSEIPTPPDYRCGELGNLGAGYVELAAGGRTAPNPGSGCMAAEVPGGR
ncbi:hypothetical protein Vretimale_12681 [Volvox reticuliferus]|uniref:Uncharacterized protein n=1 Tax=Volvox reticuliferus TaxID=1737510 RepID=A0A8J4FEV4_9CHLO|nr:hypothetical protein Vretifemale_145 [Volvox reticuliferus]GIM08677.1 hypothetical protein Vretimale_12681 [Volvox reticuliferus]